MLSRNCGFLPIIDPQDTVVGVITDRDMSIALATRNRLPGEITVKEVSSGTTHSCKTDDDIRTALGTMAAKKVRRLAVLDGGGKLKGILSVDDIVLRADSRAGGSLSSDEILRSLRDVYSAQLQTAQKKVAAG
jgi:CBS domain-containing protein